jgi:hypothetical protein
MDRSARVDESSDAFAAAERPPFRTPLSLLRFLTVSGLAGLVAGIIVGGAGARLFMRIAGAAAGERARGATTEAGFTVGEITVGGTVELVVFVGIFAGIVGASLYVLFRPWLAWAGPWRGTAFGVVLFALGSATSDVLNPDNVDFAILGNEFLVVATAFALFIGFGALIDAAFRWPGRLHRVRRVHGPRPRGGDGPVGPGDVHAQHVRLRPTRRRIAVRRCDRHGDTWVDRLGLLHLG